MVKSCYRFQPKKTEEPGENDVLPFEIRLSDLMKERPYKCRLCERFLDGRCRRLNGECSFAHGMTEWEPQRCNYERSENECDGGGCRRVVYCERTREYYNKSSDRVCPFRHIGETKGNLHKRVYSRPGDAIELSTNSLFLIVREEGREFDLNDLLECVGACFSLGMKSFAINCKTKVGGDTLKVLTRSAVYINEQNLDKLEYRLTKAVKGGFESFLVNC